MLDVDSFFLAPSAQKPLSLMWLRENLMRLTSCRKGHPRPLLDKRSDIPAG